MKPMSYDESRCFAADTVSAVGCGREVAEANFERSTVDETWSGRYRGRR